MTSWTERLPGRGLSLSVHRFEPAAPEGPAVLLLHGFLDAGSNWDLVGTELARRGLSVWAPDLRGFGRSDRVSGGGYYHFPDYVADVKALVDAMAPEQLVMVGHSMGGTVACLYAGAFPDALEALVLLEGVGPPAMGSDATLVRMRSWLAELERLKTPRTLASLTEAARRLSFHHPGVPLEVLESRARHLTVAAPDGSLAWAHDPLHRTTSPSAFQVDAFKVFLGEIRCPVIFVSGGDSGWHPPDEAERLAAFPSPPEVRVLESAGHMMHWTRPAEVAQAIADACGLGCAEPRS